MHDLLGLALLLLIATAAAIGLLALVIARDAVRPPRRTAGYAVAHGLALDPGECGHRHESWLLERPDGARLPVWEIPGAAHGGTFVLVHDWGRSRIDMLPVADLVLPLCERLVTYDLRGHGEASGGSSRLGVGEQRDLLALLERLDGGPCVLVGHGIGAGVAIAAAVEAGGRVAGVAAYGPCTDFHAALRGRLAAQGLPTRPLTDLALLALRCRGLRPRDRQADAGRLACPLLVVRGAADALCTADDARRLAAAAPDGRLLTIEGAGRDDVHRHQVRAQRRALAALTGGATPVPAGA